MPAPSAANEPALDRTDRAVVLAVGLAALAAYVATAAPGVVVEGDCAEYVVAAHVGGIPHAPGAPTYVLLATLVGLAAGGESLARALNLTSAVFGAATVALVALLALRLARRAFPAAPPAVARLAAATAGGVLAGATEFWNQALAAEVYTLSTLLLALCLGSLWSGRRASAALTAGLAFGVHYDVGVPCALLVIWSAWRGRRELGARGLARTAAAFALGLATFLYLPLRSLSDPALDFGDPETPERFGRMLTLADMPTGKAFARPLGLLGQQVAAVARLAGEQWPAWVFALIAAGLAAAILTPALRACGAALACVVLLDYAGILAMANFAIVPEELYELRFLFLPAYLAFALLAGLGGAWIVAAAGKKAGRLSAGAAALFLLALAPAALWRWRQLDRSDDRVLVEYGERMLAEAEGPAVLFTYGDNAWMALAYLQMVEGARADVTLVAAGLLRHPWYRAELRRRHPELVLLEEAPGVAGIARANLHRARIYHADPHEHAIPGLQEVPAGLLTELLPAEAPRRAPRIPPAPALASRHAPHDRREQSLLAHQVQAYLRLAEWCRSSGFAAEARAACEEGLRVSVPEPRMEDVHLVRAALLLDLGQLEAAAGRAEAARASWQRAVEEAPGSEPARAAARRLEREEAKSPP